ncbi:MAG: hypothetical protein A4E70_01718 [Syntrophus sp. PtaU1.Bin005]|nr:MAG: hypothetical protein A4E70_01718 [Syntrophus sp. PtaU1.Bin005]
MPTTDEKNNPFLEFLKTWPGIITQILVLISTLLGLLKMCDLLPTASWQKAKQDVTPLKVEPSKITFETIPYYLKNNVGLETKENPLYWFKFWVQNRTNADLVVRITFQLHERSDVPVVVLHPDDNVFTIPKSKDQVWWPSPPMEPRFEFTTEDVKDTVLNINVEILSWDRKISYYANPAKIKILSKNKFTWDLRTPEGGMVSRDFLAASLTAWVFSEDSAVRKRAGEILSLFRAADGAPQVVDRWFEACCENLFKGNERIDVNTETESRRLFKREIVEIRPPGQVLTEKGASPLEAALLVGALSRQAVLQSSKVKNVMGKEDLRVVLFSLPEDETILAWTFKKGDWEGISMNNALSEDYRLNKEKTRKRLEELMKMEPELVDALSSKGVFVDKSRRFLAVDLKKARKDFGIQGLP